MPDEIDRVALPQKWIHSHEEDTGDELVFRPSSHRFPPSRGRRSFQLSPDGSTMEQGIGPDYRPTRSSGSWSLNNANELDIVRTDGSKTMQRLVRVEPDRLVAKKN
jgi:hypothetical protein